jgi:diguanylate cyclase (GGDEF)-like protein/PAS domain S-box-containing protein
MNPKSDNRRHAAADINNILLELVDHLDAMVAYWDINQACVFANNAYLDWFGKTRQEMIGITLEGLLGPIYPKNLPYIRAAYEGKIQVFEREIPTPEGGVRHSLATYTPHILDGQVHGIFVHVADVTPLKRLEHELRAAKVEAEKLATHDFLTGLPNRVLLHDRILQALALSKREHRMVAVLSFDLDDFKLINDTYGHAAGDRFLIEIASRLKHSLREFDSVTRMGGDEFILLIPEIESRAQIETMAGRIMERVKAPFKLGEETLSPKCSLGIALYPQQGTKPEALIANSDRALYLAKKLGKNRYAFADHKEMK